MLLKITGSSGSGKTTAARLAARGHDGLMTYDFDEIGVPSGADVTWRQRSCEAWIARALESQADGLDVLLTGQSPLGEILACPSATELDGIAICLLEVADHERLARLEQRDPGRWDREAQRAFVGWARWHHAHALNPRAHPEVICSGGWEEMCWSRWINWEVADLRWHTAILDSTGQLPEATGIALSDWIERSRTARDEGTLALRAGWANLS